MKRRFLLSISFLLVVGLQIGFGQPLQSDEPILESYDIGQGSNQTAETKGFQARLSDRYFGNGLARANIKYKIGEGASLLSLFVSRTVNPGEVQLALLVFRVEVKGYDLSGTEVYSRDLNGFEFGDSKSGEWFKVLDDVPTNTYRLRITFIGNYE